MLFRNFFSAVCGAALIVLCLCPCFVHAAIVEERVVSVSAYVGGNSSVIFSGKACPFCQVTLLLEGIIKDQDVCDSNADFQLTSSNTSSGSHIFGIYSVDTENKQSDTASFNANISQGTLTYFSNIFISPTLRVNSEVSRGDDLIISGYAVPNANVSIVLDNGEELVIETIASAEGLFYHVLATGNLALGTYSIKAQAEVEGDVSSYSRIIEFEVKEIISDGTDDNNDEDESDDEEKDDSKERFCGGKADYSDDCRIDIVDFSILLHWFRKENIPSRLDLNNDNKINLTDFSILIYHWTG